VTALRIGNIGALQLKQRRNHYRLSVLGLGDIPVYMNFTESEAPPGADVMVEGLLVNIAAGGAAVRCDLKESVQIARAQEMLARFFLPEVPDSFSWRCRIVHQRLVKQSDSRIFGLEFLESRNDRSSNREAERIHQFVICHQRKKIRRPR
jgi:c-di-GMP-binding flagellar brake protein YcgR